MRLVSFHLKGFRSVASSGECYVDPRITLLAGKNESGKSALLDGLQHFMQCQNLDTRRDKTLDFSGEPSLETKWELTDADLADLQKRLEMSALNAKSLTAVWQGADPQLSGPLCDEVERLLQLKQTEVHQLIEAACLRDLQYPKERLPVEVDQRMEILREHLRNPKSPESAAAVRASVEGVVNRYEQHLLQHPKWEQWPDFVRDLMPTVTLYRDFTAELPDSIAVVDAVQSPIVRDLCALAGIDIDQLAAHENEVDRWRLLETASIAITDSFSAYWNQESLEILIRHNDTNLSFMVQSPDRRTTVDRRTYRPSQRSKGFRWYLSFFITLYAQLKAKTRPGLILIDEPGNHLHACAQTDLLAMLEELTRHDYQCLIATHSPYLIQPDQFGRVRLVTKDSDTKRTRVSNKPYHRKGDRDSMKPLITALGLKAIELSSHFKERNVIVEGPSDYFYLLAMRHYLQTHSLLSNVPDVAFVPCNGAANAQLLVSIFEGWGLDYAVLLDKKNTARTGAKLKKWIVPEHKLIRVGQNEGDSIEDLFGPQEVCQFICSATEQRDKTTLARRFLSQVEMNSDRLLRDETITAFAQLFSAIATAFAGATTRQQTAVGLQAD